MDKPGARAHAYFSGRVQGVCFRDYTRQTATALGLTGWVRNLPDGRVEAVMEGARAAVDLAVLECRKGPRGARVDSVDLSWTDATGEFADFRITH
jgi:acylphosphatase